MSLDTESSDRLDQLKSILADESLQGRSNYIDFLDSIDSARELRDYWPIIRKAKGQKGQSLIEWYADNLAKWPNPELSAEFQKECPLVIGRLDTTQKIRVLLRAADFRSVPSLVMGQVYQDILHKHLVEGLNELTYPDFRKGGDWNKALRIVYHTQLQACSLTELLLPGNTSSGWSTDYGMRIWFNIEDETKVALEG